MNHGYRWEPIHLDNPGISKVPALVIIASLLITALLPGCLDIEEPDRREFVEYSVLVIADSPFVVDLPMPDCDPVSDRLRVTKGKGEFYITDTPHGTCIHVSGESSVTIKARWYPDVPNERSLMTINLTTMDPNLTEPYVWEDYNLSIPHRNIWIQWIDGTNVRVLLFSSMLYYQMKYSFDTIYSRDPLELGWNEIAMRGGAGSNDI